MQKNNLNSSIFWQRLHIVYLQKIKEEEIIEILRELKSNNRTEIEQDILFEYLKRT